MFTLSSTSVHVFVDCSVRESLKHPLLIANHSCHLDATSCSSVLKNNTNYVIMSFLFCLFDGQEFINKSLAATNWTRFGFTLVLCRKALTQMFRFRPVYLKLQLANGCGQSFWKCSVNIMSVNNYLCFSFRGELVKNIKRVKWGDDVLRQRRFQTKAFLYNDKWRKKIT